MQYRRLGDAGMKVSSVALGCMNFGQMKTKSYGRSLTDIDDVRQIVTTAYEQGINFFDTADVYAGGDSEAMLGAVLQDFARHTVVISTKVFNASSNEVNDRGLSRKHIMESIDRSLQRLQTDYLDIYFCHRYDTETPLEEVVRAMDDLIHRGKILYWGTSEWKATQIAEAVEFARRHNLYPPKVEQPKYNMLSRKRVETQILPVTEPNGIGLTAWFPLAEGILTGKYDEDIPQSSRFHRNRNKSKTFLNGCEKARQLKPIADELSITRAQLALAWCLRQFGVSIVITGATGPNQVVDNAKAADVQFDQDILERIEAVLASED